MHKMAIRTNSLSPKHTWVPWIIINGIFRQDNQDQATQNLLNLICKLFQDLLQLCAQNEKIAKIDAKKNI